MFVFLSGRHYVSMSGPHVGPKRDSHQPTCPLNSGCDLSTPSLSSRQQGNRTSAIMSAATSSLKHASVYGFSQRDHPSSSSSNYSPLRRLQHLTTMVSQPDLVLPVREPKRTWDWEAPKKQKGQEIYKDSWTDFTSRKYCETLYTNKEESPGKSPAGQKQPEVPTRSTDPPTGKQSNHVPSKKNTEGNSSGPPSPAFSLDSNSPFANGLLHFESALFEDDDADQVRETVSPIEGLRDIHENKGDVPQAASGDLNLNSKDVSLSSAKVVTRSQSSGQRRRYWDGSEDEWDSDTDLFMFVDSPSRQSWASLTFITLVKIITLNF